VLRQLQTVVGQVVNAVQFVFVFTLLAGGIVLYSAMLTAFDERRYELSVMRALGAQRQQWGVRCSSNWRSGALSGLFAAIGALVLGGLVSRQVFQLELAYNAWLPVAAATVAR
jgi:putative ABC transport system permease protein